MAPYSKQLQNDNGSSSSGLDRNRHMISIERLLPVFWVLHEVDPFRSGIWGQQCVSRFPDRKNDNVPIKIPVPPVLPGDRPACFPLRIINGCRRGPYWIWYRGILNPGFLSDRSRGKPHIRCHRPVHDKQVLRPDTAHTGTGYRRFRRAGPAVPSSGPAPIRPRFWCGSSRSWNSRGVLVRSHANRLISGDPINRAVNRVSDEKNLFRRAKLFDPALVHDQYPVRKGHGFHLVMGHIDHVWFSEPMQFLQFHPHG